MAMASLDPAVYGGFAAVGRPLQGGPAIDLFIPVAGRGLFHTWYGPSGWNRGESGDVQLQQIAATGDGETFCHQPSAVSWAPDRLDVFAVSDRGDLWHFWAIGEQQPAASWTGESLGHPDTGGLVSGAGAVAHGQGKITVFARSGQGGTLMMCVRDPADEERWTWRDPVNEVGWPKPPGEFVFAPGCCSWGPDRIDVFCVSGTTHAGTLEHTWQQDYPDPEWHPDYWEQPPAFILTSTPIPLGWSDPKRHFVIYRMVPGINGSSVAISHWIDRAAGVSQTSGNAYDRSFLHHPGAELDWHDEIIYEQVSSDDDVLSFPTLTSCEKDRLDAFWIRGDLQLQHGWANTGQGVKGGVWEWENLPVGWPSG